MFMIMFVLDNPDLMDQVLLAWEKAGIGGATIVESTGIQRMRSSSTPLQHLFRVPRNVEEGHLTLFVIVESEALVQVCLQASEQITGDLNGPHTGVFAAWPLTVVRGVSSQAGG